MGRESRRFDNACILARVPRYTASVRVSVRSCGLSSEMFALRELRFVCSCACSKSPRSVRDVAV